MAVPFKVKAVFEYKSDEPGDLSFSVGQIITVTEEDDEDWYTGEYEDSSGKVTGIFPRNFVEKYEPPIPSRPVRSVPKPVPPPTAIPETLPQTVANPVLTPQKEPDLRSEPHLQNKTIERSEEVKVKPNVEQKVVDSKPAKQPPPPVSDKPSSSSFKDRIAAFNKPAAAPVTPFKPSGGSSTGFVKKPFVAPPPSRNSYVPPLVQTASAPKPLKRDEPQETLRQDEDRGATGSEPGKGEQPEVAEQPKPTSLKERIALLQQQQLEQAQKAAEKKKARKPQPPQDVEPAESEIEKIRSTEAPLTRQDTEHELSKKQLDTGSDEGQSESDSGSVGGNDNEIAIPTTIPPPPRELVSDTNDADDSGAADTEDAQETSTEEDRRVSRNVKPPSTSTLTLASKSSALGQKDEDCVEAASEAAEEDGEDTEDEDPEVRRRREIRERMAKMSGGMGMMGMFGPIGGTPATSKKSKAPRVEKVSQDPQHEAETTRAPPVPIMALPGMSTKSIPKEVEESEQEPASPTPLESSRSATVDEDYVSHQPTRRSTDRSGPSSPYERAAPPPPSRDTRALPPQPHLERLGQAPPPLPPTRDDGFVDADTTQSAGASRTSLEYRPTRQTSVRKDPSALPPSAPPPPPARTLTSESLTSTHSTQEKRMSRPPPPPPPPSSAAPSSSQMRSPPPPPPAPPSRSTTAGSKGLGISQTQAEDESEEEVTEYDGDYDTDIASGAKHKDALKAHNRDSSVDDDGTLLDEPPKLPSSPPVRAVPPLPPSMPPRDIPPPPPPTSIPKSRLSHEIPRAAPPPIPTARAPIEDEGIDADESENYQHAYRQQPSFSPPQPPAKSPPVPYPSIPQTFEEDDAEDMYSAPSHAPPPMPPPRQQAPPMPTETISAPPPPPPQFAAPMMAGALGPAPVPPQAPSSSLDIARAPTVSRRSVEQSRPSTDFGFMASDVDLAEASLWWTHDNTAPPSVAARTDVLFEVESTTNTKRGGKTTITRGVYVLYLDYSQTTIDVSFDPNDPKNATISQSHERPPPPPRQDQLESVSHSFGNKISVAAGQAAGSTVADGSSAGFIWAMLQPFRGNALMPVGNRSFGAVVYANLANASTQQFDEIRPGDIVTFRNAKFAGHKGGLHQKYSLDVGVPGRDHVAIVIDWDGTKKKIRAWEQGRDEKKGTKGKVKEESFRIGDLKSGEVRVWRIMGRSWVGWDSS